MQSRIPCRFTIVEIVLTIGFLVVGITSIMALFPVGLSANCDSLGGGYAADSADQFLHWYATQAKTDWATYTGSDWLPTAKSTALVDGCEQDNWDTAESIGANLTYQKHAVENGLFRLKSVQGIGADEVIDFSGVYRFWQGSVDYWYWEESTASWKQGSVGSDIAVAINLEASWPAELPYARRRKAVYRLEIFKPWTGTSMAPQQIRCRL